MVILIDTGSTHNFINSRIMKNVNHDTLPTQELSVRVADGSNIFCSSFCQDLKWSMGGEDYKADMKVLTMTGYDMVLGIEWLITVGPSSWDFEKLTLTF